jgi:hypothetical protein
MHTPFFNKSSAFMIISLIISLLQTQLIADEGELKNADSLSVTLNDFDNPNYSLDDVSFMQKADEHYGLGSIPAFPHFGNEYRSSLYIIGKGESKKVSDHDVMFITMFNDDLFRFVQSKAHSFVLDNKSYVLITVYSSDVGVLLASVFESPQKSLGKVSEYQKVTVTDMQRTMYPLKGYPVKSKLELKPAKPFSEALFSREILQDMNYTVEVDTKKNILNLYEANRGKKTLLATFDHLKDKNEKWSLLDKAPIISRFDLKGLFPELKIKKGTMIHQRE